MEWTAGQSPLGRLQQQSAHLSTAHCWRTVKLRLVVRSDLWRIFSAFLVLLVFPLVAGVNHLGRVIVVLRVQPKPLRWRLGTILSQLRDEDVGVGVLGDRRRPFDKVTLHRH